MADWIILASLYLQAFRRQWEEQAPLLLSSIISSSVVTFVITLSVFNISAQQYLQLYLVYSNL